MPERSLEVVDFGAFPLPSQLFRDYLAGAEGVRAFFAGARWGLDSLADAAERTLTLHRPIEALAASLSQQQQARGDALAASRAGRLAHPGAVAVVTGQQAGLFGGPMLVLFKALAVVELARFLEDRRGTPVVPLFWIASDDHDFAEVRSVSVLDDLGQIKTLSYSPRVAPAGLPASAIRLDDTILGVIDELARALPVGPNRDTALELVSASCAPGATLPEAFAALLSRLLPGLVIADGADPALKRLMVPVLRREILEASPTSRFASEVGQALAAAGYHQQIPVRSGFLNAFVMLNGERRALAVREGQLEVRGTETTWSPANAVRQLEEDPSAWSPGALLRPLAQDWVFPTAAYVGGPAEIAYHAQLGPSYGHFGIPRPVLVPRPSLTIVEPGQARALDAEGLRVEDLQGDPEALVSRWTREAHPAVEEAFIRARQAVDRELGGIEETLAGLDPTLRAAADGTRGRVLHQLETLHEKAIRALKKRDEIRATRLRRTRNALLPGGQLQERALGLIGLVARHGLGVIDEVRGRMNPWAKGHQILRL